MMFWNIEANEHRMKENMFLHNDIVTRSLGTLSSLLSYTNKCKSVSKSISNFLFLFVVICPYSITSWVKNENNLFQSRNVNWSHMPVWDDPLIRLEYLSGVRKRFRFRTNIGNFGVHKYFSSTEYLEICHSLHIKSTNLFQKNMNPSIPTHETKPSVLNRRLPRA